MSLLLAPGAIESDVAGQAAEEAAIMWLVELRSGEADADSQAQFAAWLNADVCHQRAWRKLGQAVDTSFAQVGGLSAAAIGRTLNQAAQQGGKRRRLLGGALLLAGSALGTAWMMRGTPFVPDWSADLHTATARRRAITLADGSVLTLNARTSVDLDFNGQQRLVRLLQGDLVADVADPGGAPFIVQSPHGRVRALGRRFMVGLGAAHTRALALVSDLALEPAQAIDTTLLHQGQAARFDTHRVTPLPQAVPGQAAAWLQGKLLAFDQPLGEVVEALRPYIAGLVRITPQAYALRVTGNYSLDDPAHTLRVLGETLPISVSARAGGLLTSIDLPPA